MARRAEFQLGAITHQHMLKMANLEHMEELHGSWGNHFKAQGHPEKAKAAWNNAAFTARKSAAHMENFAPAKTEKLSGPRVEQYDKRN